jgi:hypothetical protein
MNRHSDRQERKKDKDRKEERKKETYIIKTRK